MAGSLLAALFGYNILMLFGRKSSVSQQTAVIDGPPGRLDDLVELSNAFYGSFDHSHLWDAAMRIQRGDHTFTFVGGGAHFDVFQIPTHGPMDVALKMAHASFLESVSPARLASWRACLKKVKRLTRTPLIPPIEIIEKPDAFLALAMPYGPTEKSTAASHWQPLEKCEEELQKTLQTQGLIIDDWLQTRCWNGIPFVCDFSDLREALHDRKTGKA